MITIISNREKLSLTKQSERIQEHFERFEKAFLNYLIIWNEEGLTTEGRSDIYYELINLSTKYKKDYIEKIFQRNIQVDLNKVKPLLESTNVK